jgi:hypothetical protein
MMVCVCWTGAMSLANNWRSKSNRRGGRFGTTCGTRRSTQTRFLLKKVVGMCNVHGLGTPDLEFQTQAFKYAAL